ncbi:MAG: hypothetical protein AAB834_01170, partial [Patescibacteria group bacterium]
ATRVAQQIDAEIVSFGMQHVFLEEGIALERDLRLRTAIGVIGLAKQSRLEIPRVIIDGVSDTDTFDHLIRLVPTRLIAVTADREVRIGRRLTNVSSRLDPDSVRFDIEEADRLATQSGQEALFARANYTVANEGEDLAADVAGLAKAVRKYLEWPLSEAHGNHSEFWVGIESATGYSVQVDVP